MTASCPFRCYFTQKENAGSRLFHASRKVMGIRSRAHVVADVYLQHRHWGRDDDILEGGVKLKGDRILR